MQNKIISIVKRIKEFRFFLILLQNRILYWIKLWYEIGHELVIVVYGIKYNINLI